MTAFAVLLVVLAGAALATLLVAAGRRAREARAFRRHVAELVGRVQWVHDEGSLEVLGSSTLPERLEAVWVDTRWRMHDAAARASALAASSRDPDTVRELRDLGHALGRLTGALDTNVSLYLQMSGDPAVEAALDDASETVMDRRSELDRALAPLTDRL